jgi:hypothetical protein
LPEAECIHRACTPAMLSYLADPGERSRPSRSHAHPPPAVPNHPGQPVCNCVCNSINLPKSPRRELAVVKRAAHWVPACMCGLAMIMGSVAVA